MMKNIVQIVLWLLAVAALSGCSTVMELSSSSQVKVDKGRPVVYIHPLAPESYTQATVGILPFMVPENIDPSQGERVAMLFKEIWLGKGPFTRIKLLDESYVNVEQAVAVGRRAGCDLVVAASLAVGLDGTDLGGARAEVSLRVVNVASANTVWYLQQAMDQPLAHPNNSFWGRVAQSVSPPPVKRSSAAPSLINMLAAIAVDTADVMAGRRYVRR